MISIATKGMFINTVKTKGLAGVMPASPQLAKAFDVKISEVSEIDSEQKIDIKVTTLVEGDY